MLRAHQLRIARGLALQPYGPHHLPHALHLATPLDDAHLQTMLPVRIAGPNAPHTRRESTSPSALSEALTRLTTPRSGAYAHRRCYDFEAAALHEIGHFLGLGHPDNIPENWAYPTTAIAGPRAGNNSYNEAINTAVMAGNRPSGVCTDPWADVKAGVPSDAVIDTTRLGRSYPIRAAQMEAFAQHNPRACLTDDDLEALAVLYPDCSPYAMYHNVCNKVQHHIGLVRTGVYIVVPGLRARLHATRVAPPRQATLHHPPHLSPPRSTAVRPLPQSYCSSSSPSIASSTFSRAERSAGCEQLTPRL